MFVGEAEKIFIKENYFVAHMSVGPDTTCFSSFFFVSLICILFILLFVCFFYFLHFSFYFICFVSGLFKWVPYLDPYTIPSLNLFFGIFYCHLLKLPFWQWVDDHPKVVCCRKREWTVCVTEFVWVNMYLRSEDYGRLSCKNVSERHLAAKFNINAISTTRWRR